MFSNLNELVILHCPRQACRDSELERSGKRGQPSGSFAAHSNSLFSFLSLAAAAHLAASVPAAGAQQPARVPDAAGAPPAAAVPGAGLAGGGQQHPAEAPADLHRAAAPARGPFPGNALAAAL